MIERAGRQQTIHETDEPSGTSPPYRNENLFRPSLALIPASNWDVEGRGPDPATWRYRVYLNGPSGTTVAMRPAAGVVHAVYSVDPARP